MIKVSTFGWVPEFARGFVRDVRVRWALEEAGIPYEEHLIGPEHQGSSAYRALQPFGQVPAIEDGDLKLFESGAIVLHVAERSEVLLPKEPVARARATAWVFAALNSIEPAAESLAGLDVFHKGESWVEARRPALAAEVERRLSAVDGWLGEKPYLEERFTAGDLMMATVLRVVRDRVFERPRLRGYVERCEARPAFARAMADHLRPFAARSA